jgi:hypothetical protein
MPAPDRRSDPMKFDAARLMPRGPGNALMKALERTRGDEVALGSLELRATGINGTRIAALSGSQVGAGAAMRRALAQSQRACGRVAAGRVATADLSATRRGIATGSTSAAESLRRLNAVATGLRPVGVSGLASSMPGTRIQRLPRLSDVMPMAHVRPTLDMSGTTKAIDRLEAMCSPGGTLESQKEALETIERRLAWDRPAGPSAELIGLQRAATEAGEAIAADRRAQVERDEEMVRAMQAMEAALIESAEREAVSVKRAEAAEAREITAEARESAAEARSEELNARLVKLTVQLVILTCISVIVGMGAVVAALR